MFRHLFVALVALSVVACADNSDPLGNVTASGQNPVTGPQPSGGGSGNPSTDDPEPTGGVTSSSGSETDSTSETSGTGGGEPTRAVCDDYLACLAVTQPANLPAAQMGFGPDGTCWEGSQEMIDQCLEACAAGLASGHEAFPDQPKCYPCQEHSDCPAGERCGAHKCGVPACGDSVVDDDEVCDWGSDSWCSESCQDGDINCNPFSHHGCPAGMICDPGGDLNLCFEPFGPMVGDGDICDGATCGPGLACVPASWTQGCSGANCCVPLCNLKLPDECTNGRVCVASLESTEVGACELP
ncbi:hypothetical protein [Nannocystis bainbridge]|uniref:Tryptophan synthase alpha chain n=1 Tax=Nannocystis bainbridge TaxID=2995303 RepID=A0ABT5DYU5_9BACT|nr:hypothetical protein [Nannocystis bainbridge]MDC0718770.1 hypothetical protein [Nannocystis bainbridge]